VRVWRLVAARHTARAFSGDGAAAFGGRWNPPGLRMVYTADSLALATLELSVHLTGARLKYTAIEVDVPDHLLGTLEVADLRRNWAANEDATSRIGAAWARAGSSLALAVPSALVDARSDERNVLLNPLHEGIAAVVEVQRFDVTLDERI
jgi:RES domain-containing protein